MLMSFDSLDYSEQILEENFVIKKICFGSTSAAKSLFETSENRYSAEIITIDFGLN